MTTSETKINITFREYARFLIHYLRPRRHLVLFLGTTLFIHVALQLVNPLILRNFIDTATTGGSVQLLAKLALLFIAIAVGQQLLGILVVYITEILGWSTTNDLRQELARHTLGLDMSFHTSHTPGEMIERIDGDVMALSNFFSQFILQVFGNLMLVTGALVILFRVDWRVGLSLSLFVVITIIILLGLANIAVGAWEKERQSSANLFGFLEERLSGTEDIRSNNAKNYVMDRFYRLTRDLMGKTIRAGIRLNVLLNITWVLFAIGTAVALIISAALYQANQITLGTVFMIVYYTNMINWPLERITQQMQDLQKAGASLVRIIGVKRLQTSIPGENIFVLPTETLLESGPIAVTFENVTFGYNDSLGSQPAISLNQGQESINSGSTLKPSLQKPEPDPPNVEPADKEMVLNDISFQLDSGRIIGLLGRTGSGKTTLTRLLFRLYDPDKGRILFRVNGRKPEDFIDLRRLTPQELRRSVGMVTQNIQLFHATVRENLSFFDNSISDERILKAIQDLGLWEWFDSLPNGLGTDLESGGGGLSAGEAQLLAFTRIFLRDPGLVILDEATSRLDPATEGLIERAIGKLVQNRTAIIVAHRLGTVERADDILILEDGKILEYGERSLLATDPNSRFYHLLETGLEEVLV
jgi:ATP-binding cassette subfamily B protein